MDTDWADIFYLGATQKAGQISDTDSLFATTLGRENGRGRLAEGKPRRGETRRKSSESK